MGTAKSPNIGLREMEMSQMLKNHDIREQKKYTQSRCNMPLGDTKI